MQFLYATNGTIYIYTNYSKSYSTQYTMEEIEFALNPSTFFKANRQFIINKNIVKNIENYFGRRPVVTTTCATPEKIIVSRQKFKHFLNWIEY